MPPRKVAAKPQAVTLPPAKLAELESTKGASKDSLRAQMIFNSWAIGKKPGLRKTILPAAGTTKKQKLSLPRGYRSKEYDTIEVRVGEELNAVVFKYYNELMTDDIFAEAVKKDRTRRGIINKKGSSEMDGWVDGGGFGINYVAGAVMEKRHEYLGPAPMVAGYRYLRSTEHDIQVLWYDSFLEDRWCENESWDIDVEVVVDVKGEANWVLKQT